MTTDRCTVELGNTLKFVTFLKAVLFLPPKKKKKKRIIIYIFLNYPSTRETYVLYTRLTLLFQSRHGDTTEDRQISRLMASVCRTIIALFP